MKKGLQVLGLATMVRSIPAVSQRKNKKLWSILLLAGTSMIMPLASTSTLLAQTTTPNVPTQPLSPTDPAAKLDPALRNNAGAMVPQYGQAPRGFINKAATHNLSDRSTKLDAISTSTTPDRSGSQTSAGSLGINALVKPEDSLVRPQTVIGSDNRIRISDTTAYPWRAMTKLYMTFPNGLTYICSGTLISSKYVLTAGHCIHDASKGGWARRVEVIPGLNGTYKPYGSAYATNMRTYTGWTQYRDVNHDFALVTLDRHIGNSTGWLGYGSFSTVNGVTGNLAGYPGDRDYGVRLYYHYGPINTSTAQRLFYQIDTAGGQSGSGVYRIESSGRYVFGVHAYGGSYNSATRIDYTKFNSIRSWINSGY